jgi:glycosyltransferase involved in cell wall biosynthesis
LAARSLSIALFSDSALPIINGVSVSIDLLVRELRSRGHSVHLFTSGYRGYVDPDPNSHRFRSIRTPWTTDYPLAIPPFYARLREFRRHRFDIVHTHTPWTVGFVGLRWAESHEIPIVSTYHTNYDKYSYYVPFVPKRYLRYKISKHLHFYYNRVGHVITPSETSMRWIQRHSVHRPITIVPTGVPPPRLLDRAESRNELGIAPETRLVLYVGRVAKEKNVGVLLEAIALAVAEEPRITFMVVGDGPARSQYATQARELGIGDHVRFVGAQKRTEVDRYYAAADLFAFASMTETQGLVVVEAMSHGLPVLVGQGGGAGELVEDGVNGFLLRNDPADFAESLSACLGDDALYSRLASGARQTARANTVAATTDRVLAVYESVLATGYTNRAERVHA